LPFKIPPEIIFGTERWAGAAERNKPKPRTNAKQADVNVFMRNSPDKILPSED
jgi:hypothetical protein